MDEKSTDNIIELILDHEDVQQYLHPELSSRLPIKIVTNNLLATEVNIRKHGHLVLFTENQTSPPYFEIVKYEKNGNSIYFNIRYDVEGVTIEGEASTLEGEAKLTKVDVIEN